MLIGKVVRALREGLGLSQEELAGKLQTSGPFLSMMETGRRFASVQYQDDIYWRLARLAGSHRSREAVVDLYGYLIASDLHTREPMVYQLLGEHFYQQFREEQKQAETKNRNRKKFTRLWNSRWSRAGNE